MKININSPWASLAVQHAVIKQFIVTNVLYFTASEYTHTDRGNSSLLNCDAYPHARHGKTCTGLQPYYYLIRMVS